MRHRCYGGKTENDRENVYLLEKKIERRLEEDLARQMAKFRKEARDEIREIYGEFLEILLSEIEVELRNRKPWRKK